MKTFKIDTNKVTTPHVIDIAFVLMFSSTVLSCNDILTEIVVSDDRDEFTIKFYDAGNGYDKEMTFEFKTVLNTNVFITKNKHTEITVEDVFKFER